MKIIYSYDPEKNNSISFLVPVISSAQLYFVSSMAILFIFPCYSASPLAVRCHTTKQMNHRLIRLEPFCETDFDRLISWITNEKELVQFAGSVFSFPLTKDQLRNYLADTKRFTFKVVHIGTGIIIGHCEAYKVNEQSSKLCRILIGNKGFRGKGYGTLLTQLLTEWAFDNLPANSVDLNVYDFNTCAIRAYERVGFRKTAVNEAPTRVSNESWTSYKMRIDRDIFYEKL